MNVMNHVYLRCSEHPTNTKFYSSTHFSSSSTRILLRRNSCSTLALYPFLSTVCLINLKVSTIYYTGEKCGKSPTINFRVCIASLELTAKIVRSFLHYFPIKKRRRRRYIPIKITRPFVYSQTFIIPFDHLFSICTPTHNISISIKILLRDPGKQFHSWLVSDFPSRPPRRWQL